MTRDFGVFVFLAISVHLAAVIVPSQHGSESGGDGGQTLVSLQGSSAQAAMMVQEWDRPPEIVEIERPQEVSKAPVSSPITPTQEVESIPAPTPEMPVPEAAEIDTLSVESIPTLTNPSLQITTNATVLADQSPTRPTPNTIQPPPSSEPDFQPPDTHVQGMSVPLVRPVSIEQDNPVAPRNQVAATASQSQQAAGNDENTDAGTSVAATTISNGENVRLEQVWGSQIRRAIERQKRYPRKAKLRGESGATAVSVIVGTNGRLIGYNIVGSSGSQTLDVAATDAVSRAGRFPNAPEGLQGNQFTFRFRIVFE